MGQDESRKRTNHRELHPVPATCISKSNPAFRHLTEHSPRPHLPTSKIHPIHDPWLVDDPHCSSAMQTRQGTADLVYQTNRNKKTPLPRTITPAKKIPRPPGLRPGASTPPRPPRPPPTDRPSSFKNRFPGPTGPLPKRTVCPSVSRAQPQPQQARPTDDWPARAPICDWSFELSLRRLVIRSRREVAAARLWPPFLDGRFFGDGEVDGDGSMQRSWRANLFRFVRGKTRIRLALPPHFSSCP